MLRWMLGLLSILVLVGCGGEPTPIPPSEFVTEEPAPVTPTPQPTPPSFDYTEFRHRTGVFTVLIPQSWQTIDNSTANLIDVEFIPPVGFGSRIYINVTNETGTSEEDLSGSIERTLQALYNSNESYTQVNRTELVDGQMEVEYLYNDGLGAAGRESVLFQLSGNYLIMLRTFLAERDSVALITALETAKSSIVTNPAVVWGSPVAAANPDELFLVNTLAWQSNGLTHYTGEVYNTSPTAIDDVQLRIAFCNSSNAVLVEIEQPLNYGVVPQGGAVPFRVTVDSIGRVAGLNACVEQVSGKPADLPANYLTSLALETGASTSFERLVVTGTLTNQTLSPVTDIEVLVAAYNAEDQIVGQEIIALEGVRLGPGEEIPFSYTMTDMGGVPNRYTTLTQARTFSPEAASLAPLEGAE